jgi:hypothetical protein
MYFDMKNILKSNNNYISNSFMTFQINSEMVCGNYIEERRKKI